MSVALSPTQTLKEGTLEVMVAVGKAFTVIGIVVVHVVAVAV